MLQTFNKNFVFVQLNLFSVFFIKLSYDNRSHLKNRILVQYQGEAEVQPAPPFDGIFDTHTQVFRGVETRTQHRNLSASGGLGIKTFLR